METTLPVAVEASFTEDHLFYVFGVLFLFIVCVLKAFVRYTTFIEK